jgi:hypothetical protein
VSLIIKKKAIIYANRLPENNDSEGFRLHYFVETTEKKDSNNE